LRNPDEGIAVTENWRGDRNFGCLIWWANPNAGLEDIWTESDLTTKAFEHHALTSEERLVWCNWPSVCTYSLTRDLQQIRFRSTWHRSILGDQKTNAVLKSLGGKATLSPNGFES
jgi:hypothetical protein